MAHGYTALTAASGSGVLSDGAAKTGEPLTVPQLLVPGAILPSGNGFPSNSTSYNAAMAVAAARQAAASGPNPAQFHHPGWSGHPPVVAAILHYIREGQITTVKDLFAHLNRDKVKDKIHCSEIFFQFVRVISAKSGAKGLSRIFREACAQYEFQGRRVRLTRKQGLGLNLSGAISIIACDPAKLDKNRRGCIIISVTCKSCGKACNNHAKSNNNGSGPAAAGATGMNGSAAAAASGGSSDEKESGGEPHVAEPDLNCKDCTKHCDQVDKTANTIVRHWLNGPYQDKTKTINKKYGTNVYRDLQIFDETKWYNLELVFPETVRKLNPSAIAAWLHALFDSPAACPLLSVYAFEELHQLIQTRESLSIEKFPKLTATSEANAKSGKSKKKRGGKSEKNKRKRGRSDSDDSDAETPVDSDADETGSDEPSAPARRPPTRSEVKKRRTAELSANVSSSGPGAAAAAGGALDSGMESGIGGTGTGTGTGTGVIASGMGAAFMAQPQWSGPPSFHDPNPQYQPHHYYPSNQYNSTPLSYPNYTNYNSNYPPPPALPDAYSAANNGGISGLSSSAGGGSASIGMGHSSAIANPAVSPFMSPLMGAGSVPVTVPVPGAVPVTAAAASVPPLAAEQSVVVKSETAASTLPLAPKRAVIDRRPEYLKRIKDLNAEVKMAEDGRTKVHANIVMFEQQQQSAKMVSIIATQRQHLEKYDKRKVALKAQIDELEAILQKFDAKK